MAIGVAEKKINLKLALLDETAILFQGARLEIKNRKLKALAALFGAAETVSLPRERLVGLLWSNVDDKKARGSLRNLIYLQKDALGEESGYFLSDKDHIRYVGDPENSDLGELLNAAKNGDGAKLQAYSLARLQERLFCDLDGIDPAFDEWLSDTRAQIAERMIMLLQAHLVNEIQPKEAGRAAAERLSELSPENELATRYLMRLDWQDGDLGAALKRYEALWNLLEDRFDVEPSAATQDLIVALRMAQSGGGEASAVVRSNEPRATIFIRPFKTGELSDADFFVTGIRAELLDALFSVHDWVVVEPDEGELPSGSSGLFELRGVAAPGLGKLRLILTLKDLSSGRIVWNDQVSVSMELWAEQSFLAVQRLAALLVERLEYERVEQIEPLKVEELTGYDRMTRARVLMYAWDHSKDLEAEQLFRSVLDTPALATRGRIGLVELLNSRHLIFPGSEEESDRRAEALELARQGFQDHRYQLDGALCLAWAALMAGERSEAIGAAVHVVESTGANPRRRASAAEVLSLAGSEEAALTHARLSQSLDLGTSPLNHGYRVSIYFSAHEADSCLDAASRANGAIVLGDGYAAAAAQETGLEDAARLYWDRFVERLRDRWCGREKPDDAAARAWFISASPMLEGEARERLQAAIDSLPKR